MYQVAYEIWADSVLRKVIELRLWKYVHFKKDRNGNEHRNQSLHWVLKTNQTLFLVCFDQAAEELGNLTNMAQVVEFWAISLFKIIWRRQDIKLFFKMYSFNTDGKTAVALSCWWVDHKLNFKVNFMNDLVELLDSEGSDLKFVEVNPWNNFRLIDVCNFSESLDDVEASKHKLLTVLWLDLYDLRDPVKHIDGLVESGESFVFLLDYLCHPVDQL